MISVIVPIYNVKEYLTKCIESILCQTYQELEVLAVDDGSTDGSAELIDKLAQEHSKIKVVHQVNCGLSGARNTGLKYAQGEYLCFVDSDDWVEANYLEELLKSIENSNAEMAVCGYVRDGQPEETILFSTDKIERNYMERRDAVKCLDNIFRKENVLMVVAWNKLYRKEVFSDIRFPDKIHEDEFIIHNVLQNVNKIAVVNKPLYHYTIRNNSITGTQQRCNIRHLELLDAMENRLKVCNIKEYEDFFPNLVLCYFEQMIQLMLQYQESDYRKYSLNRAFRKKAIKVFVRYLPHMSNKYKLDYFALLCNPLRYRRKVMKIMKQNEESNHE